MFRVELRIEHAIHCVFLVLQWILKTTQRVGTLLIGKFSTRWGHAFGARMHRMTRPVSVEERTGGSDRSRDYIWILYELRRKFIMHRSRRISLYRVVVVCLIIAFLGSAGLWYAAETAEYNAHVRHTYVDVATGRTISNLIHPPEFPRAGCNEDVEWLLYDLGGEHMFPGLVPPAIRGDYVEVETRRFNRVNISISEMVHRMKRDSSVSGNRMVQPCLCPAHYGIPLNIVLLRHSLEMDAEVLGKKDVIHYEPRVATLVGDTVRGGVSMDTLVVSLETRLRRSDGLSPLEADFRIKREVGISRDNEERRTRVVDLTDVFTGKYMDLRSTADNKQKRMLYEGTRNMVTQDAIDGMKKNMKEYGFSGELSIGYARMGIRSLNERGEKLPVTYIDSPYSYCVQRCLAAIDPYF